MIAFQVTKFLCGNDRNIESALLTSPHLAYMSIIELPTTTLVERPHFMMQQWIIIPHLNAARLAIPLSKLEYVYSSIPTLLECIIAKKSIASRDLFLLTYPVRMEFHDDEFGLGIVDRISTASSIRPNWAIPLISSLYETVSG
ncbi:hypothetical protein LINGRAHAP2_LOCUS25304 [Linum grandiflorum]